MNADEVAVLYQRELYRTGGIVLGAEPISSWRPADPHLRTIVDGIDVLHGFTGKRLVDVGLLADLLRSDDDSVEWLPLLRYLMERWDDVQCFLARWSHAFAASAEVFRLSRALRTRVDRLERARAAAEKTLAELHAACDRFEMEVSW